MSICRHVIITLPCHEESIFLLQFSSLSLFLSVSVSSMPRLRIRHITCRISDDFVVLNIIIVITIGFFCSSSAVLLSSFYWVVFAIFAGALSLSLSLSASKSIKWCDCMKRPSKCRDNTHITILYNFVVAVASRCYVCL